MEDVQSRASEVAIPIDRVGIRNVRLPLVIKEREGGHQHTVASAELGVDLPVDFKGTHMSRFVEVLEGWNEHIGYDSMKGLLNAIKTRLTAEKAQVSLSFPYFIRKKSPVTLSSCLQGYDCVLSGELGSGKPRISLSVVVPVMTVCPCSKAISEEGAHSQRADVRIFAELSHFCWIEDFIDVAEASGSCPTYPLLKREDEKYVTEYAFANPRFVEDVVREVASRLEKNTCIFRFRVEVESYESIHAHNAFAWIERTL